MIICGYNEVTKNLQGKFVDLNVPDGDNFIRGDPTNAEILRMAGIEHEDLLIAATGDDVRNIFIALVAKELNPQIKVGAVLKKDDHADSAREVGVDYILLESEVLGKEILKNLLSPMIAETTMQIVVSDILNFYSAPLPRIYRNKKLKETDIRKRFGTVIAIKRKNQVIRNPSPETVLQEGDILIFLRKP